MLSLDPPKHTYTVSADSLSSLMHPTCGSASCVVSLNPSHEDMWLMSAQDGNIACSGILPYSGQKNSTPKRFRQATQQDL